MDEQINIETNTAVEVAPFDPSTLTEVLVKESDGRRYIWDNIKINWVEVTE